MKKQRMPRKVKKRHLKKMAELEKYFIKLSEYMQYLEGLRIDDNILKGKNKVKRGCPITHRFINPRVIQSAEVKGISF